MIVFEKPVGALHQGRIYVEKDFEEKESSDVPKKFSILNLNIHINYGNNNNETLKRE